MNPFDFPILGQEDGGFHEEGDISQSKFLSQNLISAESKSKPPQFEPTKVVLIWNLPIDVTEKDLYTISSNFGRVQQVFMLMQKSIAFIEFDTVENAMGAVELSTSNEYKIRQNRIYFCFTSREEIQNDLDSNPKSRILLITITNIKYPINVDILHQIFSKFGEIEKIIIF